MKRDEFHGRASVQSRPNDFVDTFPFNQDQMISWTRFRSFETKNGVCTTKITNDWRFVNKAKRFRRVLSNQDQLLFRRVPVPRSTKTKSCYNQDQSRFPILRSTKTKPFSTKTKMCAATNQDQSQSIVFRIRVQPRPSDSVDHNNQEWFADKRERESEKKQKA